MVGPAAPAHACSCAWDDGLRQIAHADQIFTGEVTSQRDGRSSTMYGPRAAVSFAVDDVYKGPVARTAIVLAVRQTASCGYEFENGGRYLVYAVKDQEDPALLTTGLCTGTKLLAGAATAENALGQPREPVAGGPSVDDYTARPSKVLLVGGGVAVLAAVGGSVWIWRRRRTARTVFRGAQT